MSRPAMSFAQDWYLYLSKLVTLPGASDAFLRLVLDQFLFSPIFIRIFLATLEIHHKLSDSLRFKQTGRLMHAHCGFYFNMYLFTTLIHVFAANVIALAWNAILSFKAHKEKEVGTTVCGGTSSVKGVAGDDYGRPDGTSSVEARVAVEGSEGETLSSLILRWRPSLHSLPALHRHRARTISNTAR
ncbi:hypothetical protein V8G54_021385 [Vigna mungo]|uniref:Uncharacterized protein n=1 Tax=Vigna mungo TaxID=3915 RepID=A0AAQ3NDE1_VIGMU